MIINEEKDGFAELKEEEDPYVLTALIWQFLDNLQVVQFIKIIAGIFHVQ